MGADAYAATAQVALCAEGRRVPVGAARASEAPRPARRQLGLAENGVRETARVAGDPRSGRVPLRAGRDRVPAGVGLGRGAGGCHALVERFVEESGLSAAATEFGQMVAVELPTGDPDGAAASLFDEHRIEVPCFERDGRPLLRISVQGYNDEEDIEQLVEAMRLDVGALGEAVLEQPARTRQTRGVRGLPRRPPMTEIDVRAFDQYEAAGWQLVAGLYERVWSSSTSSGRRLPTRCSGRRSGPARRGRRNRSGRCRREGKRARRASDRNRCRGRHGRDRSRALSGCFLRRGVRHGPSVPRRVVRCGRSGTSSSSTSASPSGRLERSRESSSRGAYCLVDLGRPRAVSLLRGAARRNCGRSGSSAERDPTRTVVLRVRERRHVPEPALAPPASSRCRSA